MGPENALVIAADKIMGMGSKKEQVVKAKEMLSGDAELGDSLDAWLGGWAIEDGEGETEQENEPEEKRVKKAKEYTSDRIERMGPEMRERLIVRLLAQGLGSVG